MRWIWEALVFNGNCSGLNESGQPPFFKKFNIAHYIITFFLFPILCQITIRPKNVYPF